MLTNIYRNEVDLDHVICRGSATVTGSVELPNGTSQRVILEVVRYVPFVSTDIGPALIDTLNRKIRLLEAMPDVVGSTNYPAYAQFLYAGTNAELFDEILEMGFGLRRKPIPLDVLEEELELFSRNNRKSSVLEDESPGIEPRITATDGFGYDRGRGEDWYGDRQTRRESREFGWFCRQSDRDIGYRWWRD